MVSRLPAACDSCSRLHRDEVSCDAYPSGIPAEVGFGADPHRELRGDEEKPLTYSFLEGKEEQAAAYERMLSVRRARGQ